MINLSNATKQLISKLFSGDDVRIVEELIVSECGDNLPLVDESYTQLAERIRFAVLRLSAGNIQELKNHIAQAKTDWRDTLVAAGFANNLEDHLKWKP